MVTENRNIKHAHQFFHMWCESFLIVATNKLYIYIYIYMMKLGVVSSRILLNDLGSSIEKWHECGTIAGIWEK